MNKQELKEKTFKLINTQEVIDASEMLNLIDQLDEPEMLSQEWINNHTDKFVSNWDLRFVSTKDLQNLLVPKQELPIVPQHVVDWFEEMSLRTTLSYVLGELNKAYGNNQKMYKWIKTLTGPSPNDLANAQEIIARMFLDGYEIEQEPKYYVIFPAEVRQRALDDQELFVERDFNYLATDRESYWIDDTRQDGLSWEERSSFTEQEIKDFDERYFQFAVPVEEADADG